MARLTNGEFNRRLRELRNPSTEIPYSRDDGRARPTSQAPPGSPPLRPVSAAPNPLSEIGNAIDLACTIRRASPNLFRNIGPAGLIGQLSPGYRNLFDSTWDRICQDTPDGVPFPVPNPDFSGGQCDEIEYAVQTGYTWYNNNVTCAPIAGGGSRDFWGPIVGARVLTPQTSPSSITLEVDVYCKGPSSGPIQPLGWFRALTGNPSLIACPPTVLDSLVVIRTDGLPDDCGNGPPQYPNDPEPPIPPNLSIDINLGGGNTINVPVNISFNPDIGININIGDDININHDGDDIDFDIPGPTPGLPPAPGGGAKPSPDDTTTDPDDPDPPPPPSGDDPATEEPPEEPPEVIRAVLVTVTSVDPASSVIFQEDNPDVYIPDLGVVNFRCRARDGASGWTPDQRVKNLRCFIVCEWDGGAFEVKGTPRPGVEWTLTPIIDLSSIPVS